MKVTSIHISCYPSTHEVDQETIVGKYVFFRDEFREWTFRIQAEHRTDPSRGHRPPGTRCPIK